MTDAMSFLEGEVGFTTQMVLWGYVVQGDILEKSAVIAEGSNVEAIVPGAWDHDLAWLHRQLVAHGAEPYRHPPESWCLPAVSAVSAQDRGGAGTDATAG